MYSVWYYTFIQCLILAIGVCLIVYGLLRLYWRKKYNNDSFTKAFYTTKSKTDIRGFKEHKHKDRVDSIEYGQAPYTAYMMRKTNSSRAVIID